MTANKLDYSSFNPLNSLLSWKWAIYDSIIIGALLIGFLSNT